MDHDVKRILSDHFLLKHLSSVELDRLSRLAFTRPYKTNEPVFLKGDDGTAMMAILKGRVRVCSYSADGREVVLNIMTAGQVFGEIAMIDGGPRTADVFAMEPTELLVLSRRDFLPFLERNPSVAVKLLEVMCQRLRWTSSQVEDFFFLDLKSRLAKRLLQLAAIGRRHADPSSGIDVQVSQQLLANMIGTSREAVNKQLRIWEGAGLIELKRGSITILDSAALERVVDETTD